MGFACRQGLRPWRKVDGEVGLGRLCAVCRDLELSFAEPFKRKPTAEEGTLGLRVLGDLDAGSESADAVSAEGWDGGGVEGRSSDDCARGRGEGRSIWTRGWSAIRAVERYVALRAWRQAAAFRSRGLQAQSRMGSGPWARTAAESRGRRARTTARAGAAESRSTGTRVRRGLNQAFGPS